MEKGRIIFWPKMAKVSLIIFCFLSVFSYSLATAASEIVLPSGENNKEIIIAVIDTGVDYNHPDFENQMWDGRNCKDENGNFLGDCIHGYDFADDDKDPLPATTSDQYHGTAVASVIVSQIKEGIKISPQSLNIKIMAIRFGFTIEEEIRAIDFARENGAQVINFSSANSAYIPEEHDAIKRFTDNGGIFVTVAANCQQDNDGVDSKPDGSDLCDHAHKFPSDYSDLEDIISVASVDKNNERAYFSDWGISSVDLAAPGSDIESAWKDNSHITLSGTSMSAPYVTATAAMLLSFDPILTNTQVKDILMKTGQDISDLKDKTVSGKKVDTEAAIATILSKY